MDKPGKKNSAGHPGTVIASGARTMASFWRNSFVAVALIFGVATGGLLYLQYQQAERGGVQELVWGAESLAKHLSGLLGYYHALLQRLARDPELIALFRNKDQKGLEARERSLNELIPGALRVRLLPAGYDRPDADTDPPLSFASLELIRAAEEPGREVPLEVHNFGTPQAHLAAAVGVFSDPHSRAVGVLHAAYPLAPLQAWIDDAAAPPVGRLALQQRAEGRVLTLVSGSRVAALDSRPLGVVEVKGTLLQVAYWYFPHDRYSARALVWWGAILVGSLTLIALVFLLQYRHLRKALVNDQAGLISIVDDFLDGRAGMRFPTSLADFAPTVELIGNRLRSSHGARGGRVPTPAVAKGGAGDVPEPAPVVAEPPPAGAEGYVVETLSELARGIFRAYDIRGVVGVSLTPEVVHEIGRAVGSQAYDEGQQTVIVARDGRDSGLELTQALIEGLTATGRDVIDLGLVPTPILYFSTHFLGSNTGVMVTGSHNPPEYNGLKIVMGGEALGGEALLALWRRVEVGNLLQGEGTVQQQDLVPDYLNRVVEDVRIPRPLKVAIDSGNGTAGLVAPAVYGALGCEVIELFSEVDGGFPNHHPDPSRPENMQSLRKEVVARGADIGLAFDGDGDRLGVVDSRGKIIWPDRVLMLLAADVLTRHPGGDVIYDVKCSRNLASQILQHGGRPVMWKSGHSLLKAKLRETGALLAGEWSGHIVFKERWYGFDDAIYAGARLLEILGLDPRSSAELFSELPESVSTPELILPLEEGTAQKIVDQVLRHANSLTGARVSTIDGLRAEFEEGWGLVRASNTTPSLTFRFEADTQTGLEKIQKLYRALMLRVKPDLKMPF